MSPLAANDLPVSSDRATQEASGCETQAAALLAKLRASETLDRSNQVYAEKAKEMIWLSGMGHLIPPWEDGEISGSKALLSAKTRHAQEALATLRRAGMTSLGNMVPEW
jgi:hypothetical protein